MASNSPSSKGLNAVERERRLSRTQPSPGRSGITVELPWNENRGSPGECLITSFVEDEGDLKEIFEELADPHDKPYTSPAGRGSDINSPNSSLSSITSFLGAHNRDIVYFITAFNRIRSRILGISDSGLDREIKVEKPLGLQLRKEMAPMCQTPY